MKHLWLAAGSGGFVGSVIRHLVNSWLKVPHAGFPWATTTVNLIGCFAIGATAAWFESREELAPWWHTFVVTGLLGGLTTFSAFGLDFHRLMRSGTTGTTGTAWLSVVFQVFGGLLAVALGWRLLKLFG